MSKRYRDYVLALLLLAGSGLLAALLLWQWAHYRAREADLKNRLAAKVEVRLQAPPPEKQPDALPGLDSYAVTVERPLFMEGRRPGEAESKETEAPPAPHLPLTAKLMGVVLTPEQSVGLFIDAHGKYKRLHKNDALGGWKMVEIHADKVIMEQDGSREELKLLKTKPKKSQLLAPGVPPPGGPFPGQPPMPMPVPPPFGPNPTPLPVNPDQPIDSDQPTPNDAVDETIAPPEPIEGITNEQ